LNKRTIQQIRRNTSVRFREVVQAYVVEERRWILANLTTGKPTRDRKTFVEEFKKRLRNPTKRLRERILCVQSILGPLGVNLA